MTPGTSGRFNFGPIDGARRRRDLSSSDVDVSCNREPPPWLSQREGQILGQARAAYQSDALRCDWPQMNTIRQAGARDGPPRLAPERYRDRRTWWLPCREAGRRRGPPRRLPPLLPGRPRPDPGRPDRLRAPPQVTAVRW